MGHSDHGVAKDRQGQEQPTDKARAQAVHKTDPGKSATHEATRDRKLRDAAKAPGSSGTPDDGNAPAR